MAEFCRQCSIDLFGEDYRELAGLVEAGQLCEVICEGCGFVTVDHDGNCQGGEQCLKKHQPLKGGEQDGQASQEGR